MKPFCLTIAGSDPTSGAGIQADIRTFDRIGVHPFSAVTAITYQTATEFYGYKSLSEELEKQLDALFNSYSIKYVKIGMIPDAKSLEIIKSTISVNSLIAILDPVNISSAGSRISSEGLEHEIERDLFPLITVLTPNLDEACYFANIDPDNESNDDLKVLKEAAETIIKKMYVDQEISKIQKAVVIKSAGKDQNNIFDLVCVSNLTKSKRILDYKIFKKQKISVQGNVHGTGCVFSSAITGFLSLGNPIVTSIEKAEAFFNRKFHKFIELPKGGKLLDLTLETEQISVINQIKEIYNYISNIANFRKLIPEVRMNISGSLPNATSKEDIAGIEGRITIIGGYPHASGEVKFNVSDHTARLILSAKEFDTSINFVTNLRYNEEYIKKIQEKTSLAAFEFLRESQPDSIKHEERSTMRWLIEDSINKIGKVPDIIWDKGSIGKEPMIRLFSKTSKDMIQKLMKIMKVIDNE